MEEHSAAVQYLSLRTGSSGLLRNTTGVSLALLYIRYFRTRLNSTLLFKALVAALPLL